MASLKVLTFGVASVKWTKMIAEAMKMVAAAALATGLCASAAHAAPPTIESITPTIKSFCARSFKPASPAWVLCVGQQTQGYLDFAKAYPETAPPVMEGFDRCQAAYAPSGNWALLDFCASERLRAADQLK